MHYNNTHLLKDTTVQQDYWTTGLLSNRTTEQQNYWINMIFPYYK